MKIDNLTTSISEMKRDEALSHILSLRESRRTTKEPIRKVRARTAKGKVKKKRDLTKLEKEMQEIQRQLQIIEARMRDES